MMQTAAAHSDAFPPPLPLMRCRLFAERTTIWMSCRKGACGNGLSSSPPAPSPPASTVAASAAAGVAADNRVAAHPAADVFSTQTDASASAVTAG